MKKKIFATVLLSGIVLAASAPKANADTPASLADNEINVRADNKDDRSTDVTVDLTKDGTKVVPGPYAGKLAFTHIPDFFKFSGTVNDAILKNKVNSPENQFVVVNDDRRETAGDLTTAVRKGKWTLTANMGKLTAGAEELNAKLSFKLADTPDGGSKFQVYDIGPLETKTESGVEVTDFKPAPYVPTAPNAANNVYKFSNETITLDAGGATVNVMGKEDDAVQMPNGVQIRIADAELALNGAAKGGSYKGKLLWSLNDGYQP